MLDPASPRHPASVRDLLEVARIPDDVSLRGTRITRELLADPLSEIATRDEVRVIDNVVAAVPDRTDIGLDSGARCRLDAFGMTGLLMLYGENLAQAFASSIRYQDLCYPLPRSAHQRVGSTVVITLDPSDYPRHLHAYLIDHQLAAIDAIITQLRGRGMRARSVELVQPRPPHAERHTALFGVRPVFGAPLDRIVVDARELDDPFPQANPAVVAQLDANCRTVLQRRRARVGATGMVRHRLERANGPIPTLEMVAADVAMSPRTLRRALAAEGSSFRSLDIEVRLARATHLLETTALSVEAVGRDLGYATASAFVHAFTRWAGQSPGAHRRAHVARTSR
ncbi:AraC family transcriptional regulator [Geodermatophilus sp. DSM 44513]|uniref:AraC family transcriptional regulator n=1 Tax=Geodermatophilus sp. DSM 44513 TaxID=1528104 RepID=UPI00127B7296|nr:AraC family transcriptional regulator [Geodermatophilus sp. DSM 44513]WNV74283.1 AraC family transcriptional regulator ligand-binding domain-containing protein [Geodermatophilus sp. DSM 44513]